MFNKSFGTPFGGGTGGFGTTSTFGQQSKQLNFVLLHVLLISWTLPSADIQRDKQRRGYYNYFAQILI